MQVVHSLVFIIGKEAVVTSWVCPERLRVLRLRFDSFDKMIDFDWNCLCKGQLERGGGGMAAINHHFDSYIKSTRTLNFLLNKLPPTFLRQFILKSCL